MSANFNRNGALENFVSGVLGLALAFGLAACRVENPSRVLSESTPTVTPTSSDSSRVPNPSLPVPTPTSSPTGGDVGQEPAPKPPTPTAKPTVDIGKIRLMVRPAPKDMLVANPLMGLAAWSTDSISESVLPVSTIIVPVTWKVLEPVASGQPDWAALEKLWDPWTKAGKKIGFVLSTASPGFSFHNDIPDWLIKTGVNMRSYVTSDLIYDLGYAPDWDNARLQSEHARLVKAIAAKYDGDPRLAFFMVGTYGIQGTWFLDGNDKLSASLNSKNALAAHWTQSFTRTPVHFFGADPASPKMAQASARGLIAECLGEDSQNKALQNDLATQFPSGQLLPWLKQGKLASRFCTGSDGNVLRDASAFQKLLTTITSLGVAWMDTNGSSLSTTHLFSSDTYDANSKKLFKSLGYHFSIQELSHDNRIAVGTTLDIGLKILNTGSTAFPANWPLEIALVGNDGVQQLRARYSSAPVAPSNWYPGLTTLSLPPLDIPLNFKTGTYHVTLAILDPTTGAPGVQFENDSRLADGHYSFTDLEVIIP